MADRADGSDDLSAFEPLNQRGGTTAEWVRDAALEEAFLLLLFELAAERFIEGAFPDSFARLDAFGVSAGSAAARGINGTAGRGARHRDGGVCSRAVASTPSAGSAGADGLVDDGLASAG